MSSLSLNGVPTGGQLFELKKEVKIEDAHRIASTDPKSEVFVEGNNGKNYVVRGDALNLEGLSKSKQGQAPVVSIITDEKQEIAGNFKGVAYTPKTATTENVTNTKSSSVGGYIRSALVASGISTAIASKVAISSLSSPNKLILGALTGVAIGLRIHHGLTKALAPKDPNALPEYIQKK